jgi:truncated hemoglobin YjbI
MFMLDTLTDLKNNKVRKEPQSISGTTEELQENLKKYLGGLSKKTGTKGDQMGRVGQCVLLQI